MGGRETRYRAEDGRGSQWRYSKLDIRHLAFEI
jgi:hypothetical protein